MNTMCAIYGWFVLSGCCPVIVGLTALVIWIPDNAVVYLARQIAIEPTRITFYDFSDRDRTSKAPRTQIREALGFR
jgi:hypothetical protein